MKKLLSLLLPFCLVMSSCATLFSGSTQSVAIASSTKDAKIYVDGEFVGKDYARVELKKAKNHYVDIKKDGFKPAYKNITKDLQAGWVILDVLLLELVVPIVVDAITGAWYELSPDNINVELEPEHK
jgi:hypothetical protein